jgi:hypothetical protein
VKSIEEKMYSKKQSLLTTINRLIAGSNRRTHHYRHTCHTGCTVLHDANWAQEHKEHMEQLGGRILADLHIYQRVKTEDDLMLPSSHQVFSHGSNSDTPRFLIRSDVV